ncbi:Ankyrin repeat-containing domain [Phytophthora cactorum]|nr:Ankyrin repeat-containing domain [Phytophthora cactorum]
MGVLEFIDAVLEGNLATVQMLVHQAAILEKEEALRWAAWRGHLAVVQYLVEKCGVDVNAADSDGVTALMEAASTGMVEVIGYLVNQCNVDVNTPTRAGNTVLIKAASAGNIEVVRYLAAECSADVNVASKNGMTTLMKASSRGNIQGAAAYGAIDVIWYLAEKCGADVNVTTMDGETALMKAAKKDVNVANKCGADVNAKTNGGDTTLSRTATQGRVFLIGTSLRMFMPRARRGRPMSVLLLIMASTKFDGYQCHSFNLPPKPIRGSREKNVFSFIVPFIHPSEIELAISHNDNIGGNFRAKWLDADVSVNLFIPVSSNSTFEDEVCQWQQLRHPNVIKTYGGCIAGPKLQFFVCEYASQGSLIKLTHPTLFTKSTMGKWLYEDSNIFMSGGLCMEIFAAVIL